MVYQQHDRPTTDDRTTRRDRPTNASPAWTASDPARPASDPARPASDGQRVVASFDSYGQAERAVDYLSDRRFPVQRVAIVGRGLSSIEQVTGRLTSWGAAGRSALSGAIVGALFGWIFGLFNWINPVISAALLALYGAIFGAILGGLLGLLSHAMTGGRRDFSSTAAMRADRYDVLVDAEAADEAARLLAEPDAAQLHGTP